MNNFKPMLAKDGDITKLSFPLAMQEKLDGIRATVVNGVVLARSLKPIPNREIQEVLGQAEYEGLDGELIVGDPTAEDCFQRTTSFVRGAGKTNEPWSFIVFDDVTHPERPYALRRDGYRMRLDHISWTDVPVFPVNERIVQTMDEVDEFEAQLLAVGHEGAILRDLAAPYKFGRSGKTGPLIKLKRFIDYEAEVIGVYEELRNENEAVRNALGRTERSSHAAGKVGKNTLGGLMLRALNGPHEGQEFRCGTGFSKPQREALWAEYQAGMTLDNPLLERVAKIKSFPLGVKDAPRFPVWLGWREDFDS